MIEIRKTEIGLKTVDGYTAAMDMPREPGGGMGDNTLQGSEEAFAAVTARTLGECLAGVEKIYTSCIDRWEQYARAEIKKRDGLIDSFVAQLKPLQELRHLDDWHEGTGDVLWYQIDTEKGEPMGQPPWVGSPLDSDWPPGGEGDVFMWRPLGPWPTRLVPSREEQEIDADSHR